VTQPSESVASARRTMFCDKTKLEWLVGAMRVMAGRAFTWTLKLHLLVLPAASVATHRIVVVPTGKEDPDGGWQRMAGARSQLSVAVALKDA